MHGDSTPSRHMTARCHLNQNHTMKIDGHGRKLQSALAGFHA